MLYTQFCPYPVDWMPCAAVCHRSEPASSTPCGTSAHWWPSASPSAHRRRSEPAPWSHLLPLVVVCQPWPSASPSASNTPWTGCRALRSAIGRNQPAAPRVERLPIGEKNGKKQKNCRKMCNFAPFLRAKNSSRKAYKGTILFPVCYSIKILSAASIE